MFNTFFHGSVDELLTHVGTAPVSEIEKVQDIDRKLFGEELIQTVMDEFKVARDEAKRIVEEIQMEELDCVLKSLLDKGEIEVTGYDKDGQPIYMPVKKVE